MAKKLTDIEVMCPAIRGPAMAVYCRKSLIRFWDKTEILRCSGCGAICPSEGHTSYAMISIHD